MVGRRAVCLEFVCKRSRHLARCICQAYLLFVRTGNRWAYKWPTSMFLKTVVSFIHAEKVKVGLGCIKRLSRTNET